MNKLKFFPIVGLAVALIACGKESSKNEVQIQLPKPISELPAVSTKSMVTEQPVEKSHALRSSYDKCVAQSGGSDALMLDCIHEETDFQDKQLNAVYKKALSLLDDAGKAKLVAAQKAWLVFTEADNKFNLTAGGEGTAADVTADESYLNQLGQRVESLNATVEMLQVR